MRKEHQKLTDRLVKDAAAPARGNRIDYDADVKGFGLRVTKAGAKSFVLNYWINGRDKRLTIGSYPDWSAAAAREEAKRLKREIDRGRDPLGERVAERDAPTVNDLADRFLADHAELKKRERSRRDDEGLLNQWIRPELGKRKVAAIRPADVDALHGKITAGGAPVRANRAAALLSTMFTLAIRWDMRANNPVKGLERNVEQPRQRYLTGDELRRLTAALAAHPHQAAANAIRLLLLTGARRGEVLGATWEQFDLGAGVWTKPSAHTKQKRQHRVPLSAPARQLLAEMKAAAERCEIATNRGSSPFVFPGRFGAEPLGDVKKSWAAVCRAAQITGVHVHDLRHTYASLLASDGLSLPVIGALLGHTQASTTQRYAHLFDDPLRAATERVGSAITGAVGAAIDPGAIVVLRRPA
jgi:integrase